MSNSFILYGANGYTGRLIASLAAQYQLKPILAGRNNSGIKQLAEELDLPYRIADLNDANAVKALLSGSSLLLHCAGPFSSTARLMADACIAAGVHYLDINGDISVFELLKKYDLPAKQKNIMIMPGVGFDVVPTDCMALQLKNRMPDADHLKLAFASIGGGLSHGTATTMAEKIGEGGAVRENGRIVLKPLGQKGRWVDFVEKRLFVMSIPWGDVSTAYFTTGIGNIETYTGIAPKIYWLLKMQWAFNWLLRKQSIRKLIQKKIDAKPAGPTDEKRKNSKSLVWGEAGNAAGKTIQGVISCLDGYSLTAHSSLIITKKILAGNFKPGYQTPAAVYGEGLIMEIPGSKNLL